MSMILLLIIALLGWHGAAAITRLAVDAVATMIGAALFAHAARVRRRILALRDRRVSEDVSQRSSRSERRLTATGLKLALRQTEFRSLFPQVASRCERLVSFGYHGQLSALCSLSGHVTR